MKITTLILIMLIIMTACSPSDAFIQTSVASTRNFNATMTSTYQRPPTATLPPTNTSSPTSTMKPTETTIATGQWDIDQATQTFFESALSITYDQFLAKEYEANTLLDLPCLVSSIDEKLDGFWCNWPDKAEKFHISIERINQTVQKNSVLAIFGYQNGTIFLGNELTPYPNIRAEYIETITGLQTATAVRATKDIIDYAYEPDAEEFMTFPDRFNHVVVKTPCLVTFVNDYDYQEIFCQWPGFEGEYIVEMTNPFSDIVVDEFINIYGTCWGLVCFEENNGTNCYPAIAYGYYDRD